MILHALDIGGTKIGIAVGDGDGRILAHDRFATPHDRAPEDVLADALGRLAELHRHTGAAPPAALGVACPGPLDYARGRFLDPPNMPRWHGFGVREFVRAHATVPSAIMNDANASALAEWLWGNARGTDTAIYLTMSTGMGAGLIIGGRLFEGPLGLAGEIGRIRLRDDGPVGFGRRGTVEGYLSGPGMVQVAEAECIVCRHRAEHTALAAVPAGTLTPAVLLDAARAGDPAALRVVDRCAHELGRLLALLADILNPDVVVLGTIGTAYPDLFIERATRTLRAEALPGTGGHVRVVPSGLTARGDQSALAIARHLAGTTS